MPKLFLLLFELRNPVVNEEYGNLRLRLQVSHARQLLDQVYALRSENSAAELKEYFRRPLGMRDRLVIVEVAGEWASRKALVWTCKEILLLISR